MSLACRSSTVSTSPPRVRMSAPLDGTLASRTVVSLELHNIGVSWYLVWWDESVNPFCFNHGTLFYLCPEQKSCPRFFSGDPFFSFYRTTSLWFCKSLQSWQALAHHRVGLCQTLRRDLNRDTKHEDVYRECYQPWNMWLRPEACDDGRLLHEVFWHSKLEYSSCLAVSALCYQCSFDSFLIDIKV